MNIPNILNRLLGNVGIDAALLCGQYEGKTDNICITKLMLDHTESIANATCMDVRVVVGTYTIVATYDPDGTVVVALPTGHPIAKSMRRMVRRSVANSDKRSAQPRVLGTRMVANDEEAEILARHRASGRSREGATVTPAPTVEPVKPVLEEMVDKGLVEPVRAAPTTANVPKPTPVETASPTSVGGVRSW